MPFTGHEDCTIPLSDASAMNKAFRKRFPDQPKGYYFSMDTLNEILAQGDCVGIRFYFAIDGTGTFKITFAGVKANEDDIIGIVGVSGITCPKYCGVHNPLNS